jgi:integrase
MTSRYGSGSVYQRQSDKRWVGAALVAGKRRFVYGTTRKAALAKLDDLRASARDGIVPTDHQFTVGRHTTLWLDAVRPTVRPRTWTSYEGYVRLHLAPIAQVSLAALTPNDVRALIKDRLAAGCAPSTVAHTLTILRMALKQAVRDGIIVRNVALLVDAPKVTRSEIRILTTAEAFRLLDLDTPLAPLWTVLLGTGLRLGESLGLRFSDIDLTTGNLTVRVALGPVPRHARPDAPKWTRTGLRLRLAEPKSDAGRRTIALPGFVERAVQVQRDRQESLPRNILGLVFTTPRGTPLDARNVSRAFAADCQTAGLASMRLHDLRHCAASMMLGQGSTLDDVKRVLGHSSIALTSDTYGHLVAGRSREVADGMDRLLGRRLG